MLRRMSPGRLMLGVALVLVNVACTSTDAFPPAGTAVLQIRVNNVSA